MRLFGSELLKVWTAPRTVFGILLAELVIVALATIGDVHSNRNNNPLPPHFVRDLVSIASISVVFSVLLGVLVATTEYRHGTITQTFLAFPVREQVIGAKAVAAALVGALLAAPAVVLVFGLAFVWVGGHQGFDIGSHELGLIGRLFLAAAIGSALGLLIGAALARQLGAIILVLGWLVFVEHIVGGLFPGTRDYLPGRGVIGGILGTGEGFPSLGKALAVALAYLAGLGAISLVVTRRRDIT
jgi:ABC-type transport system involved in multi-copper enzyme maturation permease subunit